MRKYYLGLLFTAIITLGITRAEDSKCNFKIPSQECDCNTFLNSKGECIPTCAEGEIELEYDEFEQYKQCFSCKSIDMYINAKKDNCTKKCESEDIVDKQNKLCLDSEDKCKGYVVNKKCKHCEKDQFTDRENKKCLDKEEDCEGFIGENKICVKCKENQILYKEGKKCFDHEEQCPGFVNQKKQCIICKENEIADTKFKKCYEKDEECKGYIKNKKCNYCEEGEITDQTNGFCLKPGDCTGYIEENYCKHCLSTQLIDLVNNKCISDKSECSHIIVDDKYCTKDCPENYFKHKDDEKRCSQKCDIIEDEEKKICNEKCTETVYQVLDDQFKVQQKYCNLKSCPQASSYQVKENDKLFSCQKSCKEAQIKNQEKKQCYNTKSECKEFLSLDGLECISKCQDHHYSEDVEDTKQCKECSEIIQEQKVDSIKTIKCVSSCEEDQLIYIFGDQKQYKKCVPSSECDKKQLSLDKKSCSDECINHELKYNNECVQKCPKDTLKSSDEKSCNSKCEEGEFISSNGRACLKNCSDRYEVLDESSNKCQKCKQNEQFTYGEDSKGVCKAIRTSQSTIQNMINFLDKNKDKIQKQEVQDIVIQPIRDFTLQSEFALKKFASKENKTDEDISSIAKALQAEQQVVQQLINLIGPQLPNKSISFGSTEFNITAYIGQPGFRFRTKFDSEEIKDGSITTLLQKLDDSSNSTFDPYLMILSYIKTNYFCKDAECKNTFPLYTVSYLNPKSPKRELSTDSQNTNLQEFEMVYTINSSNKTNQIQCLSYNLEGKVTRSQGTIKSDKLICKFQVSSSLFFDENCDYVDKQYCNNTKTKDNQKEEGKEKEEPKKEQEAVNEQNEQVSSFPTKIILGVGIIGVLAIYLLRKSSPDSATAASSSTNRTQRARIQYDDDDLIMEDVEQRRRRFPKGE